MTDKTPYSILGVSKDATQGEITKAFRRKAQQLHPDKEGGSPEAFQEITEAFDTIGTVEARKNYDSGIVAITPEEVRKNLYASMQAAIAEDPLRPVLPRLLNFVTTESATLKIRLHRESRKLKILQANADRMKVRGDRPNMFHQAILGHIENCAVNVSSITSTLEMLSRVREELTFYEEGAVVNPSETEMSVDPLSIGVTWKRLGG